MMQPLIHFAGDQDRIVRIEFDGDYVRMWCSHIAMSCQPIIILKDQAIEIIGQIREITRSTS